MKLFFWTISILLIIGCTQKDTSGGSKPSDKSKSIALPIKTEINHLALIRSKMRVYKINDLCPGIEDSTFLDYTINKLLEKPEYVKYISDRSALRKLTHTVCRDNYVLIEDTLENGLNCQIKIKTKKFNPNMHVVEFNNAGNVTSVDSKFPFGAINSGILPEREIETISIKINEQELEIPNSAYQNLFEPDFCYFGGYSRITEAYLYNENIYIYIFGGNAAGSYFAKLIFDHERYITSIIVDYYPLSCYRSFSNRFVGF